MPEKGVVAGCQMRWTSSWLLVLTILRNVPVSCTAIVGRTLPNGTSAMMHDRQCLPTCSLSMAVKYTFLVSSQRGSNTPYHFKFGNAFTLHHEGLLVWCSLLRRIKTLMADHTDHTDTLIALIAPITPIIQTL